MSRGFAIKHINQPGFSPRMAHRRGKYGTHRGLDHTSIIVGLLVAVVGGILVYLFTQEMGNAPQPVFQVELGSEKVCPNSLLFSENKTSFAITVKNVGGKPGSFQPTLESVGAVVEEKSNGWIVEPQQALPIKYKLRLDKESAPEMISLNFKLTCSYEGALFRRGCKKDIALCCSYQFGSKAGRPPYQTLTYNSVPDGSCNLE